ncbi:MAG: FAD-dependent oxidoreductase [Anaerolineales bacterium]|nr:FAD-dependent oxidoreductase [Anaerolineales bacterium]MCB9144963.1 FAD-dependent oxidoreductase [Anaerolineales bacterium]
MFFSTTPRPESLRAISDVKLTPFWLDDPAKPEPTPPLTTQIQTDLAIIGGGYSGLWTALLAKQADPKRDVVLLEAGEIAIGASGRNGGFCSASLTHGFSNGKSRWEGELAKLIKLGEQNLDAIEATIKEFNIDCDFIRSGELHIATEEYQVDELREGVKEAQQYGSRVTFLTKDEVQARVHSPSYLAAVHEPGCAMLNPARLAWGLKKACLQLGVKIFEGTPVTALEEKRESILLKTPQGQVEARKTALATNAFPPLLKHLRLFVVPVYDYVLMTEPLTKEQRDSIGWHGREGLADDGNQFHYYRTTEDGRILFGGYDAIYHKNNGVAPELENHPASFALLAEHFFQTFPTLTGLRFTHAWGGVIDTCSRYTAFWGQAYRKKLAYVVGYTGLGVGASRFGAQVMLDILDGKTTERTELQMVKSKPFPFPPEPFRLPIINFTRWSLDQADRNQGRRNLWLKLLDALGLGFDS